MAALEYIDLHVMHAGSIFSLVTQRLLNHPELNNSLNQQTVDTHFRNLPFTTEDVFIFAVVRNTINVRPSDTLWLYLTIGFMTTRVTNKSLSCMRRQTMLSLVVKHDH